MSSGKQTKRRRSSGGAPTPAESRGRRASPRVLIAAAVVLVLLVAGVAAAVALSGGSSESTATTTTDVKPLPEAASAQRVLAAIPQDGNVLGSASAPVTMVEYIDLQCPYCRSFELASVPTLIARFVRPGKLKIESRPLGSLGEDSVRGREAA